jgi:hypothetical protein
MSRWRIHLQSGEYHGFWQVRDLPPRPEVWYLAREGNVVFLYDCVLRNRKAVAQRIYEGAAKNTCAWIYASEYSVCPEREAGNIRLDSLTPLFYNPREAPFWTDVKGKNIDNSEFKRIVLFEGDVYAVE